MIGLEHLPNSLYIPVSGNVASLSPGEVLRHQHSIHIRNIFHHEIQRLKRRNETNELLIILVARIMNVLPIVGQTSHLPSTNPTESLAWRSADNNIQPCPDCMSLTKHEGRKLLQCQPDDNSHRNCSGASDREDIPSRLPNRFQNPPSQNPGLVLQHRRKGQEQLASDSTQICSRSPSHFHSMYWARSSCCVLYIHLLPPACQ